MKEYRKVVCKNITKSIRLDLICSEQRMPGAMYFINT